MRSHDGGAGERWSLSILRLPASDPQRIEATRRILLGQKGVFRVDVDNLKQVVLIEYDSGKVSLERIRSILDDPE